MNHDTTNIRHRLLVALDMPTLTGAQAVARQLGQQVGGFKVGLELCTAAGVPHVIKTISATGARIFLDLKFKDIPNTVAGAMRAVAAIASNGEIGMLTLHCDGGSTMLQAAAETIRQYSHSAPPLLLGVTVLTSLDEVALSQELGIAKTLETYVVRLARLARAAGLDGVVASPHEVAAIRRACGPDFLIVTPGVRPTWAATGDQHRTMTPVQAIRAGADYLVIGRPVTSPPPEIGGPAEALERIVKDIEEGRRNDGNNSPEKP
jgi:orotidine-5'-phosphate decarboxylase